MVPGAAPRQRKRSALIPIIFWTDIFCWLHFHPRQRTESPTPTTRRVACTIPFRISTSRRFPSVCMPSSRVTASTSVGLSVPYVIIICLPSQAPFLASLPWSARSRRRHIASGPFNATIGCGAACIHRSAPSTRDRVALPRTAANALSENGPSKNN